MKVVLPCQSYNSKQLPNWTMQMTLKFGSLILLVSKTWAKQFNLSSKSKPCCLDHKFILLTIRSSHAYQSLLVNINMLHSVQQV